MVGFDGHTNNGMNVYADCMAELGIMSRVDPKNFEDFKEWTKNFIDREMKDIKVNFYGV